MATTQAAVCSHPMRDEIEIDHPAPFQRAAITGTSGARGR